MKKLIKIVLFLFVLMILYKMYIAESVKGKEEKDVEEKEEEPRASYMDIVNACKSAANDLKGWKNLDPSAYTQVLEITQKDWSQFIEKYPFYDNSGWSWKYRINNQGLAWKRTQRLKEIKAEFDRRENW